MITAKLYGLLRVEAGIRQQTLEAETVKDVLDALARAGVNKKALDGCIILVNGKAAKKRTALNPGDVVQLLPPVAGG